MLGAQVELIIALLFDIQWGEGGLPSWLLSVYKVGESGGDIFGYRRCGEILGMVNSGGVLSFAGNKDIKGTGEMFWDWARKVPHSYMFRCRSSLCGSESLGTGLIVNGLLVIRGFAKLVQ
ncbi:hypothetical protein Tco_0056515 [Tanacetum coccineum]